MIETFSLSIITLILLNKTPSELDEISRDIESDFRLGARNCSTLLFMFMSQEEKKVISAVMDYSCSPAKIFTDYLAKNLLIKVECN